MPAPSFHPIHRSRNTPALVRAALFAGICLCAAGLAVLSGCGKGQSQTPADTPRPTPAQVPVKTGDVGDDIAAQFDADFVYSATGRPIVRVEPSPLPTVKACNYYFNYKEDFYKVDNARVLPGGDYLLLVLDNLNVEKQKKGQEFLGRKLSVNSAIKMEHFVITQENGLINSIVLVINPNKFLSVDRSSGKALTNEELVDFAGKVAQKIQGQVRFAIRKNPVKLEVVNSKEPQIAVVENFFKLLSENQGDQAAAGMLTQENAKTMWKTTFKTIKSLSVKKTEPYMLDDWNAAYQIYKVTLSAQVTAEGRQYGWTNGDNIRFVTIRKNLNQWQVAEIATNP